MGTTTYIYDDDERKTLFGDIQYTQEFKQDLLINTLCFKESIGAVTVFTSECYAGTVVGQGFCFEHEAQMCRLLAMARLFYIDQEWGLGTM